MKLSERFWTKAFLILALVFVILFSHFVCRNEVTKMPFINQSVEHLDDAQSMVLKISASTLTVSYFISLLPDDHASPLAGTLADFSKYFVLLLGMIFLERLMVLEGIPLVFSIIIPASCFFFMLFILFKKEILKKIGLKLLVFGIAVLLVVPCGTYLSQTIGDRYLGYVNDTITKAEAGSEVIDDSVSMETGDKSFYEKVSALFQTAVNGLKDYINYFKNIIERFITSIAIMIIIYCGIPFITFVIFIWILNQLFQFQSFQVLGDKLIRRRRKPELQDDKLEFPDDKLRDDKED
ncbi:MAG: hypothetical protein J5749_02480 [Lachnospiraceae bacterium]|nr:hypothetical protein [Lachnospiraceae bacterium]